MMQEFNFKSGANGGVLTVDRCGPDLLRYPLHNKGTAFTAEERQRLGLEGLLPAEHNGIEQQADRIYRSIFERNDDVGKHIALAMLQDRNEVLYYKVLEQHLEEVMPVVYTPTVGKASQYYSRHFRRGRGIFITPQYRGRIEDTLRRAAPFADVRLVVATDNEAILGIGDQGAGGIAISIGKLALYCVGAGIHPARTLPVSLDVGTDNQALLDDPQYLGFRQPRLRGAEYEALVDEFVTALKAVFPRAVLQWEDLRKENALAILDRYRRVIPSFNDDIQGTGAVASACFEAGSRLAGRLAAENRVLIFGAGAAGLGIARQVKAMMRSGGLSDDAIMRRVLVMDSRGVITGQREGLDAYKRELACPAACLGEIGLGSEDLPSLHRVVAGFRPHILIGASGQAGSFDESVIREMARHTARPIVLPMSNPTSISEANPADVFAWSEGRALVATGSPFGDVQLPDRIQPVSQANNVFIFPGIGLGAVASGAREITDSMITAAASALGGCLTVEEAEAGHLLPGVSRLWDVSGQVALSVARQAMADGVATLRVDPEQRIAEWRWKPAYPEIVTTARTE